ncbi:MAG: peptide deformylase [Rhodocyclaceae bacterium]|jgi:peptide deformylase|nr:Peptide deformylase [Rhodocyclaceae bacterium]MBZ0145812.1 peptide deformylase [Rhodocyclaceae bacterium]MCL4681042.1 peptide deformylase [Rhodocyclaceae bacterium]
MIRDILRMGDMRLLEKARPVEAFGTPELYELVADMQDTMRAANGAGLAAPQIGVGLRVVVFGFESNPRYPQAEPVPSTILVNPELTPLSDELEEGWEGCLSVPGLRGVVPRSARLAYRGFDPAGAPVERVAEGFHARVVQHECDHLDGILYPMRMRDFSRFGYTEVLFPDDAIPED